jgi:hypothetical protein
MVALAGSGANHGIACAICGPWYDLRNLPTMACGALRT